MEVIIQLSPDVTENLRSKENPTPAVEQLNQATEKLGITLRAQHPGEDDPVLSRYYVVYAPSRAEGERIVASLCHLPMVEGAYVKPEAEFP